MANTKRTRCHYFLLRQIINHLEGVFELLLERKAMVVCRRFQLYSFHWNSWTKLWMSNSCMIHLLESYLSKIEDEIRGERKSDDALNSFKKLNKSVVSCLAWLFWVVLV